MLCLILISQIDGIGEEEVYGVHDIFDFDRAKSHIHPSFYNNLGQSKYLENPTNVFPNQGGLYSPYNRLKIIFEDASPDFELNTIEIHNADECNVNGASARRLFGTTLEDLKPVDKSLVDSQLLNNRAVIDFDYCKAFNSCPTVEYFEYLELNFESTRDGQNPGPCEVRVFAHRAY
jgi:hypothetical protein